MTTLKVKFKIYHVYIFIFTITITLFPTNFLGFKFLNVPIFILAFINCIFLISFSKIDKKALNFIITGLFFSFLFFLSFLINIPEKVIIKDIVEIVKPLIYFMIVLSGYILKHYLTDEKIKKYIFVLSFISILFSSLVFFPSFHNIVNMYKGKTLYEYNVHFYRFSGFMGWPGPFSYWLVLTSLLVVNEFYEKKISFFYFLIFYLSIGISIVLTGARSGLIIFIISNILYMLINIKLKRNIFYLISMVFFLIICYIFISYLKDSPAIMYLIKGFENIVESSFKQRLKELELTIENFKNGFILGSGPNNVWILNNLSKVATVETAYFFYGYKFGIFGLTFYFLIIYLSLKLFVKSQNLSLTKVFSIWSLIILTIGPLSESITEEYKSFYMYFTMLGLCLRHTLEDRENK